MNNYNSNEANERLFYIACAKAQLDAVKYLYEKNHTNLSLEHALIVASEHGHLEVVKYLIKQGADIHTCNLSPLFWAWRHEHFNVVEFLIEKINDKEKIKTFLKQNQFLNTNNF